MAIANDRQSIKCIILTLRNENIIVPDTLVAEIVSVKDIVLSDETRPAWYLGDMRWHGIDVPLLSFEAAGGMQQVSVNLNTQAVVLYAVAKDGQVVKVPYISLVMSGVPHITNFSRNQFKFDSEATEDHPMVAQNVRINGARVSILDIDAMVGMVSDLAA